jgi:hypothetical protein
MRLFLLLLLMGSSPSVFSNPFKIDTPSREETTEEQYLEIQSQLKTIQISPLLDSLYSKKKPSFWQSKKDGLRKKEDFLGRMSRGIRQTLIDPASHKIPQKKLTQINQGGDFCIVSFASFDGCYSDLLSKLPESLKKTGFNGHFLSISGGFPNPTGKEIQYSGVPYSFKIFAMLEAEKLGFSKVLWIDAGLEPLKDPSPLFAWIEKSGSFFNPRKNGKRYLLPNTREVLLQETGSDMHSTTCIRARVIGLDLKSENAKNLIKDYYHLVELGTPFMSCFPEEFVIGALLNKEPQKWPFQPFEKLVKSERKLHGKPRSSAKEEGFFFLLQHH